MAEVLIIGTIGVIYKDGTVKKDETDQGLVFKDNNAFENGQGICYIPEECGNIVENIYQGDLSKLSDEDLAICYTKQDFLDLVDGNEKLAKIVFEMVDWQDPSTLVEELYREDEVFRNELDIWKKNINK